MKKNLFIIFVLVLVTLTACDYQVTNRIEQDDLRAGDEYVYGVHPDSTARQLGVTYEAKPELDQRAVAIREKLYGGVPAQVNAESAAVTP